MLNYQRVVKWDDCSQCSKPPTSSIPPRQISLRHLLAFLRRSSAARTCKLGGDHSDWFSQVSRCFQIRDDDISSTASHFRDGFSAFLQEKWEHHKITPGDRTTFFEVLLDLLFTWTGSEKSVRSVTSPVSSQTWLPTGAEWKASNEDGELILSDDKKALKISRIQILKPDQT